MEVVGSGTSPTRLEATAGEWRELGEEREMTVNVCDHKCPGWRAVQGILISVQ